MDGSENNSSASDADSIGATIKAIFTSVLEEYEKYTAIKSAIEGLLSVKEKRMSLIDPHQLA